MPKSRLVLVLFALVAMAAGLFPMLAALDVSPALSAGMNAPRWVVFMAGSLFFIVGMWLLLHAILGAARANVFGSVVGIAIVVGLTAIANWVAFGGGDRNDCSGGISVLGFSSSRAVAELECRAAFGYGALLLDFFLLKGIAWWLANKAFPESRSVRVLDKVSEWGIGLLLLPLILVALLLQGIKDGSAALWSRMRGQEVTKRGDEKK